MDFTTQGNSSHNKPKHSVTGINQPPAKTQPSNNQHQDTKPKPPKNNKSKVNKKALVHGWLMLVLLSMVVLVSSVLLFIGLSDQPRATDLVNPNTPQVVEVSSNDSKPAYYYGQITAIRDKYLVLNDVYVLSSSVSADPVTVEPIGCASPNAGRQLVISLEHVVMWNNLDPGSSAVQAITQAANNNGNCSASNNNDNQPEAKQAEPAKPEANNSATNETKPKDNPQPQQSTAPDDSTVPKPPKSDNTTKPETP